MVANSVFLRFSEVPAHTHTVPLPLPLSWRARRAGYGVMEGPTDAPLEVNFQAFLALKNRNFRPFGSRNGSETAQKWLEERPNFGQGHGQRFS